jgi:hypothetical protein
VGSRRDQVPSAFLNCLDSSSKTSRVSGIGVWMASHRYPAQRQPTCL